MAGKPVGNGVNALAYDTHAVNGVAVRSPKSGALTDRFKLTTTVPWARLPTIFLRSKLMAVSGPYFILRCCIVLATTSFLAGNVVSQVQNNDLRTELLAMRDRDQKARNDCPTDNTEAQLKCYAQVGETIDKAHTQRLDEIVKRDGVPTAKMVGADGVRAFFLVLQHSPSLELKKKSAKGIKKAFEAKVLPAQDYAAFTDRLLANRGKRQVYGSNFDFKDGKLVMSPVKDRRKLDARRKKLGLSPIAEYARVLKEMYNMEVVVPQ